MADGDKLEGVEIDFRSGAKPDDDTVRLIGVHGREQLSRLFEFDFLIQRPERYTEDDLDDLLAAPCGLTLGPKPGDVVHGLVAHVEVVDMAHTVAGVYRLRMVPKTWLLTQTLRSQIYQDMTVPEMVTTILKAYGLKDGEDFEVHNMNAATSPKREYIAQYQESDWDFIQRWLEQEGFFYWFSHSKSGEKLIVSDSNSSATPIDDPSTISYRERNNLSAGRKSTIWSWTLNQRRVPARVSVQDYNYRTPSITLYASNAVDAKGAFGTISTYGEHFKDKSTGAAVAKLRAERVLADRRIFSGRTDCSRFRVGHSFELENHFEGSFDVKYLITSLEHRVGVPLVPSVELAENIAKRGAIGEGAQRYGANFTAIPLDVAYRPEKRTKWPRIYGVMHGHVDADTSGDYAMIDDQGRYRVRLPFDLTGGTGSKSSRWIRMAQAYSGAGYGQHFPLHKGTEVLISYVDGDPDRPVITGAVPDALTVSPSTGSNATQSVTQTASGIRIEFGRPAGNR